MDGGEAQEVGSGGSTRGQGVNKGWVSGDHFWRTPRSLQGRRAAQGEMPPSRRAKSRVRADQSSSQHLIEKDEP